MPSITQLQCPPQCPRRSSMVGSALMAAVISGVAISKSTPVR
jgi:hypothetical protein